jgi:hypothetical protein
MTHRQSRAYLSFVIHFPVYTAQVTGRAIWRTSPQFRGSLLWAMNFQTVKGSPVKCLCHFVPISCPHLSPLPFMTGLMINQLFTTTGVSVTLSVNMSSCSAAVCRRSLPVYNIQVQLHVMLPPHIAERTGRRFDHE